MLGFFARKGILMKKISSYGSIIKSFNHIMRDRKEIQKKRKISDDQIMKSFCCNMYIPPESDESNHMKSFNRILINLAKMTGFYGKVRIID